MVKIPGVSFVHLDVTSSRIIIYVDKSVDKFFNICTNRILFHIIFAVLKETNKPKKERKFIMAEFNKKLGENSQAKMEEIFLGTDIGNVREKLGRWWVCEDHSLNSYTGVGRYIFQRHGQGRIEFITKHNTITDCIDLGF